MKATAILAALWLVLQGMPAHAEGWPRAFTIPSESMLPTLLPGDYILAHRVSFKEIERGDVIVFRKPGQDSIFFVFRAIAFGGETVQLTDGIVTIDDEIASLDPRPDMTTPVKGFCAGEQQKIEGKPVCVMSLSQETLPGGATHRIVLPKERVSRMLNTKPFAVPKDHLFLLGDNRINAADSRLPRLGPVPSDSLFYRVTKRNVVQPVD